jgi:two-component system nitrogen regulation response regulator NtrX
MTCLRAPKARSWCLNAATITPERMEEELFGIEDESGNFAKSAPWKKPTAARCTSMRSPTCRRKRKARSCEFWSSRVFRASAGPEGQVDIRILSSTSKNLEEHITKGLFRQDLYHRLSVVPLRVPGLAERREDIPVLVSHFMEQISAASGIPLRPIGDDAMAVLQTHDWPGNIRQLRNNVERLLILSRGDPTAPSPRTFCRPKSAKPCRTCRRQERRTPDVGAPARGARDLSNASIFRRRSRRFDGNISRTAEFVGMERSALHRKLKTSE